jgi:Methane oxygenase PmoA
MRPALLIALCLGAVARAENPVYTWQTQGKESVSLIGPSGTLVHFKIDPKPADPHFDVLTTRDGRNLVWVSPPDHVWHYGQWFSWKVINGVNFWETDKEGKSEGIEEVLEPNIHIEGGTATVIYTRLYRLKPDANPILKDHCTIAIHWPSDATPSCGPSVDCSITTTALEKVTLDRTPLPNEPCGKPYGGYGGFSWRGAQAMTDVHFSDSEGRKDMDIHRQSAAWVNAVGTLEGKAAGVALIARSPSPVSWYIVQTPQQPFWYMNPALLQPKPIGLEAGATLKHSYRIITHDGSYVPQK